MRVREIIRETLRTRRYYLDLRGLGLREIPEEVAQMDFLENIALSRNEIEDISILAHLPHLRKVALSHNRIENLEPLRGFYNLKYLFIGHNRISDLSPLENLPNSKSSWHLPMK